MGELDERSSQANSQKIEIIALKTQVEALKERLDRCRQRTKDGRRPGRRRARRTQSRTQELTEERGKVENLGRRVTELEQQLVAQTTEAEILGRRAQDLESRLGEQSGCSTKANSNSSSCAARSKPRARSETTCASPLSELDRAAPRRRPKAQAENAQLQAEIGRTEGRTRPARSRTRGI